jgi:hypothetical protein
MTGGHEAGALSSRPTATRVIRSYTIPKPASKALPVSMWIIVETMYRGTIGSSA